MVLAAVACAVGVATMVASGLDTPIGATSAYIDNVALSSLYVIIMLRADDPHDFSLPVAWLKMLGTGLNTVFMCIHPAYAHNTFLRYLAILTGVIDCYYIYALTIRLRAQASAPALATGAPPA
jgi:hypothetical protein